MKKIIALLIAVLLSLTLCACNGDKGEVSKESASDNSEVPEQNDESSLDAEPSEAESSESYSEDESADAESSDSSSEDESSDAESSEPEETVPEYISNFVTWAKLSTALRATDNTSLRLTKINEAAGYGDIVIYTYDFVMTEVDIDGDVNDFAFLVAKYDHNLGACVKTAYYKVGAYSGTGLEIPADGFVIAAHKAQETMISRMASIPSETSLYAAGVQTCNVNYSVKETSKAITIDGKIDSEWTAYHIDSIDYTNEKWTYSMFEKDNYYTKADYYVTFDKNYLYLAVVVDSPYHYCPISAENANEMWQYECIQVKLSSESSKSDYISEHYDHVIDSTANNDGVVHSYGFAVNNNGETCYYENSGVSKEFTGKCVCLRNTDQTTTYEVAIPWTELNEGTYGKEKISLTFSINSTNEDDIGKGTFRNLILRDGGGVIGRNDWAKMPELTLVYLN